MEDSERPLSSDGLQEWPYTSFTSPLIIEYFASWPVPVSKHIMYSPHHFINSYWNLNSQERCWKKATIPLMPCMSPAYPYYQPTMHISQPYGTHIIPWWWTSTNTPVWRYDLWWLKILDGPKHSYGDLHMTTLKTPIWTCTMTLRHSYNNLQTLISQPWDTYVKPKTPHMTTLRHSHETPKKLVWRS